MLPAFRDGMSVRCFSPQRGRTELFSPVGPRGEIRTRKTNENIEEPNGGFNAKKTKKRQRFKKYIASGIGHGLRARASKTGFTHAPEEVYDMVQKVWCKADREPRRRSKVWAMVNSWRLMISNTTWAKNKHQHKQQTKRTVKLFLSI